MPNKQRGKCQLCGEWRAVRVDGTLYPHFCNGRYTSVTQEPSEIFEADVNEAIAGELCQNCGHRADEHRRLFGGPDYLCPTVPVFVPVKRHASAQPVGAVDPQADSTGNPSTREG